MSAIPRKISFGMARREPGAQPQSKYKAKPTTLMVDGEEVKFASQKEARVFTQLQLLERAGRIRDLKRQVAFHIDVGGKPVCKYVADFTFEEYIGLDGWRRVVADAKGYATPVYKLKRKLMAAALGIDIREM